jgi:hypothetical protein
MGRGGGVEAAVERSIVEAGTGEGAGERRK